MQTIEEYLNKLEEYVLLLGGDKNLVEEYADHLYAEFKDFISAHPRETITEEMFILQLEFPEVIAQSLVGDSFGIPFKFPSLGYLVELFIESIKEKKLVVLGILVMFVTGLQTLGVIRQAILPTYYLLDVLYRFRPDLRIPLSLIIPYYSLRELLQFIPFYMLSLLAYFLLYIITSKFLIREKKTNPSLVYSLNDVFIVLWVFGMIGAVITITCVSSSSLLSMLPYVFLAPSVPVLITLFQIAYQGLFYFQSQKRNGQRSISFSSSSQLLINLNLMVFVITAIQSFIIHPMRAYYLNGGQTIYHLSLVLSYFLIYKLSIALINDKEVYKISNYRLRSAFILLILFSLIGVLSIFLYIIIHNPWIYLDNHLYMIYNWVMYWFPHYSFPPLIAFIVPVLIVLFQMAYNNLFSSQFQNGEAAS
ncbi:MAG: hypothetical protein ACFFC7_03385 [Candidatus Hermodarchaeota archaeon]